MNPFVEQIQKVTLKELAKLPESRFEAWIWKTWNVLPTDERYLNLTEEQRKILWEDFLLDHPEISKEINKQKTYDPDFDKEWEKLMAEAESDAIDDFDDDFSEFKDVEEAFQSFVEQHDLHTESDEKLKQRLENRKLYNSEEEWEEVE